MLKIGLVGSAYLIEKHINSVINAGNFELVGYYNVNNNTKLTKSIAHQYEFVSLNELLDKTQLIYLFGLSEDLRMPITIQIIKSANHLLIDKSNIKSTTEAKQLLDLAEEAGVITQMSNISALAPLYKATKEHLVKPILIESVTNIHYKNKSAYLLNDLLCDELSMIINTVNANLKKVTTIGVDVSNRFPEVINTLLEFDNGCNASITINTVADEDKKNIIFYTTGATTTVDFLENKIKKVFTLNNQQDLYEEEIKITDNSQLNAELTAVLECIKQQKSFSTDLHDMLKILEILNKISEKLKINLSLVQD
ncbi:MAG: Gfo/Idh/MocA family oxidoreductase [Vicingaceae bacterium]|nr:Gfo/Idh/MocA family oxidoreductase [Vicingaceae bacterium]